MTPNDEAQLGLSATTFLTLCIAWGPDRACFAITVVAAIAGWIALARRFPLVGYFTIVFFDGFLGGLFGYRSGYGYTYRPHARRRRR